MQKSGKADPFRTATPLIRRFFLGDGKSKGGKPPADLGFDLFGDLIVPPREGPGRPEHRWTLENSHKVNLVFAMGGSVADAAAVIDVTQPTLRKHYFSEVGERRKARLKMNVRQMQLLAAQAEKGNVGAVKTLLGRLDKAALDSLAVEVARRGQAEPRAKPAKLGKKEERQAAAGRVGGRFAPRPAPMLIN